MDKRLYWASIALTIFGVLIASYMTIYKLTSNNAMCLGSGDCSTVNASPYSEIYGIPVAFVGVLGYIGILGLLIFEKRGNNFLQQNAILGAFGLAVAGFAFTLYLIYVEVYVIQALCPFCIASQITMTILFAITVTRLVRQPVK